jgi:ribosomal protein S12 methylthiotransferase accessory factor
MSRLRLSPAATATETRTGLILKSDLASFQLEGADLAAVVRSMLPLLDGTKSQEQIANGLSDYTPSSVHALIEQLKRRGLVEQVEGMADDLDTSSTSRFLKHWLHDPKPAVARLKASRVIIVGLEPWGVIAARGLVSAGIGALDLRDDRVVTSDDLAAMVGWRSDDANRPRAHAAKALLGQANSGCDIDVGAIDDLNRAGDRGETPTLILTALAAEELSVTKMWAAKAQAEGCTFVAATMEGLDSILGPVAIAASTPCWNCWRLRSLANKPRADVELALHEALLRVRPPSRNREVLPSMLSPIGHLAAVEIVKQLSQFTPSSLVGRVFVQNMVTFESSLHTVVRLPWCDVCGGASRNLDLAREPPGTLSRHPFDLIEDVDELSRQLGGLVDSRTGIVRFVSFPAPEAGEPDLPIVSTAVLASDPRHPAAAPEMGSGKGLTRSEAMLGAVGEAIERYSASLYAPRDFRRESPTDAPEDHLNPVQLCLYLDAQYNIPHFPYARLTPHQAIDWTLGHWLDNSHPVWVPCLPTYFNYPASPQEYFCQVTSNGLATGADLSDASLRATFELLERDAFMITWMARKPAVGVVKEEGLETGVREVIRQLREVGCDPIMYLLSAGVDICVVACVGRGNGRDWPGATISLAAHLKPSIAVRKAVLEQGHAGTYIRQLMLKGEKPIPSEPREIRTLADHALYYVPPKRRKAFSFLEADEPDTIDIRELPEPADASIAECGRRLKFAGLKVALVDVTSPDLIDSPFRVVRALGANVQPIHFGYGLERLANPRLIAALGGRAPNSDPHPLA